MRGIKTVAETYQRKQYLHHAFRHVANLFFLANPMSLYTLTIADSKNLLSDDIKTAIKKDVDYVIANCIDRYVDWKGTLDFKVNIKTNAEFFNEVDWAKNLSNSDGCLPGTEMAWVGSRKSNLIEATTGIDLNGSESDAGFTIYLGVDGTVKLFGVPLWLDPDPVFNTTPAIPTGYYDFISVALHEIIHTLAFDGVSDSASPFGALSTVSGDHYNFTGDHVTALLGGSLPMTADNHVVSSLCVPYAESGLMRDWGNYDQNRWDIGRIELAVMQDLGYDISADLTGLSYTDIDDKNPAIVGTAVADTLYGDFQGNKITGDAGNDKIDGGLDTDAAVYIAARANYTFDKTDSGLTVIDTTGTEGTDSLIAIERLQFTDVSLAFDTDAANNAGGIYRLYKAALNRTPDLVGLGYWIAQADAGSKDAVQMATDFTYADEFKTLYGVQTADNYMTGEDITALVTTIYENVLNRAPDAGGRDYYAGQITTHTKTVGRVLAEISDSAENYAQVAELIATGIPYTPWST